MLFADLEAYEEKINKEAARRVEEREDQVGGEDVRHAPLKGSTRHKF